MKNRRATKKKIVENIIELKELRLQEKLAISFDDYLKKRKILKI